MNESIVRMAATLADARRVLVVLSERLQAVEAALDAMRAMEYHSERAEREMQGLREGVDR